MRLVRLVRLSMRGRCMTTNAAVRLVIPTPWTPQETHSCTVGECRTLTREADWDKPGGHEEWVPETHETRQSGSGGRRPCAPPLRSPDQIRAQLLGPVDPVTYTRPTDYLRAARLRLRACCRMPLVSSAAVVLTCLENASAARRLSRLPSSHPFRL